MVVGKFLNKGNKKGVEIVIRHTPEQTGLPYWTYSQYTHLLEMSPLPIGATVKLGDEVGKTSNTGKSGKGRRRDALHFAVMYSAYPEWSNHAAVMPRDGYFMDPNAFYRRTPPYDSMSLAALPTAEKGISVPSIKKDATLVPAGSQRIWPYACGRS